MLGFSRGEDFATNCSIVLGLNVQEFLPLDGLFSMMPFLLREAIPSGNVY